LRAKGEAGEKESFMGNNLYPDRQSSS
jgi:hypothetical protein